MRVLPDGPEFEEEEVCVVSAWEVRVPTLRMVAAQAKPGEE